MNIRFAARAVAGSLLFTLSISAIALAQQFNTVSTSSGAQAAIDAAAQHGKYTFLVFYKQNDVATKAMATTLNECLAENADRGVLAYAQVDDPSQQALVTKYGLSRAPMPMALAIAPNGAITGMFPQKLSAEMVHSAFVTPGMMRTMKSLQEGKLAMIVVQGSANSPPPVGIKDLEIDPSFRDRLVTISVTAADPAESKFMEEMQIDPAAAATHTVILAPPGVMAGKFDGQVSKDEIIATLAKAGKCCDDPNCNHHQNSNTRR